MSLEQLADAVVARLTGEMPGYSVEHFPDLLPDRRTFAKVRTELLVACEGSTFGAVESHDPLSTPETIKVSVSLLVRSLRGPKGAQQAITAIRNALFGWSTPLGGTPLVPTSVECLGADQGVWTFVSYFTTTTMAVARTTQPTGPTLTAVSIEDDA